MWRKAKTTVRRSSGGRQGVVRRSSLVLSCPTGDFLTIFRCIKGSLFDLLKVGYNVPRSITIFHFHCKILPFRLDVHANPLLIPNISYFALFWLFVCLVVERKRERPCYIWGVLDLGGAWEFLYYYFFYVIK